MTLRLILPTLHVMRPVNLDRTRKELEFARIDHGEWQPPAQDLDAARLIISRTVSGHTAPSSVDRRTARAVLACISDEDSTVWRQAVARIAISARSLGWRHLWSLWERVGDEEPRVASVLAKRISTRAQRSTRFAERLPGWLPRSRAEMLKALQNPNRNVREFCEATGVGLSDAPNATGLALDGAAGQRAFLHLIRTGSFDWWTRTPAEEAREWCAGLATPYVAAVAERQLIDHYGNATGPGDLPNRPDRAALSQWILRELGDPYLHPARWAHLTSDKAKQIFEWMLVADEFGKIMAQFQRSANDDRSRFWAKYLPALRDARFYQARETAVCMMVLGSTLVIEFGRTGNACYFYESTSRPLRHVVLREREPASAFKDQARLKLGEDSARYRNRLSHNRNWQDVFRDFMHGKLRITPPTHRKIARRRPAPSTPAVNRSDAAKERTPALRRMSVDEVIRKANADASRGHPTRGAALLEEYARAHDDFSSERMEPVRIGLARLYKLQGKLRDARMQLRMVNTASLKQPMRNQVEMLVSEIELVAARRKAPASPRAKPPDRKPKQRPSQARRTDGIRRMSVPQCIDRAIMLANNSKRGKAVELLESYLKVHADRDHKLARIRTKLAELYSERRQTADARRPVRSAASTAKKEDRQRIAHVRKRLDLTNDEAPAHNARRGDELGSRADACATMADRLLRSGRAAQAGKLLNDFMQANLYNSEQLAPVYFGLGKVRQEQGKRRQAREYFELAVRTTTNDKMRQEILRALARMSGEG